jgi:hypothetical protein
MAILLKNTTEEQPSLVLFSLLTKGFNAKIFIKKYFLLSVASVSRKAVSLMKKKLKRSAYAV